MATFSFLNGIKFGNLTLLLRWPNISKKQFDKVATLLRDFETKPLHRSRYYSFNVRIGAVMYLNGGIRY